MEAQVDSRKGVDVAEVHHFVTEVGMTRFIRATGDRIGGD
jgi:hypothetical protein